MAARTHFIVRLPCSRRPEERPSSQVKAPRTNATLSAVGRSPWAITILSIGQARIWSIATRAARRSRKLARHSLRAPGLGATIPSSRATRPRHPLNQSRGKFWIRSAKRAARLRRWKNTTSVSAKLPCRTAWPMSAAHSGSGASPSSASKARSLRLRRSLGEA